MFWCLINKNNKIMRWDSTDGRAGALCLGTCKVPSSTPAQGIHLWEKEFAGHRRIARVKCFLTTKYRRVPYSSILICFHTFFIICVLLFNDITIHNLKFEMYIACGILSINKPLWTESMPNCIWCVLFFRLKHFLWLKSVQFQNCIATDYILHEN